MLTAHGLHSSRFVEATTFTGSTATFDRYMMFHQINALLPLRRVDRVRHTESFRLGRFTDTNYLFDILARNISNGK